MKACCEQMLPQSCVRSVLSGAAVLPWWAMRAHEDGSCMAFLKRHPQEKVQTLCRLPCTLLKHHKLVSQVCTTQRVVKTVLICQRECWVPTRSEIEKTMWLACLKPCTLYCSSRGSSRRESWRGGGWRWLGRLGGVACFHPACCACQ